MGLEMLIIYLLLSYTLMMGLVDECELMQKVILQRTIMKPSL